MGFSLGKLSGKWKKFKHNVLDKGSLSHNAAKLAFGKKKGTQVMDTAGVAVADIYTFGGASLATSIGQGAEAKYKYKQAKKAAKKALKASNLAKKKGLFAGTDIGATSGFLGSGGPKLGAMPMPKAGAAVSLSVLPGGSAGGQARPAGLFDQALGTVNTFLDNFGGEYSPPDMLSGPDQEAGYVEENGQPPSNMPFILIGVGALILVAALSKR